MEKHQGTVTASSEGIGKGSAFTVTLPLYKTIKTVSGEKTESRNIDETPLTNVKILCVEDDLDSREVLQLFLEQNGAFVEIGLCAPTRDPYEFFAAGRRVPAGYTWARPRQCSDGSDGRCRHGAGSSSSSALTPFASSSAGSPASLSWRFCSRHSSANSARSPSRAISAAASRARP